MPSEHEGLGIAALEALVCGVPSVLADVEGLRDIHEVSASLKLVPPSAEGVAHGVSTLIATDAQVVAQATSQVAANVRDVHDQRQQIERLLQIYRGD